MMGIVEKLKKWFNRPKVLTLKQAVKVDCDTYCEMRWGVPLILSSPEEIKRWAKRYQYGYTWRCWTHKPSEELRRKTPWENKGGQDK